MRKFSILLSCMHNDYETLAKRSNIQCDALIINQCDEDSEAQTTLPGGNVVRCINTTERGLSRSRNMAIRNADAEICLLADDDEIFEDDVAGIVVGAFEENPKADVILFNVSNTNYKPYSKKMRISYRRAMSGGSLRIAFKRRAILQTGIAFDVEMGSGTGYGACEEVKFLFDCKRRGLEVLAVPLTIASMIEGSPSQWFKGYTQDYFLQQGWATRRFLGTPLATLYAFYTVVMKYPKYKSATTPLTALKTLLRGIYSPDVFRK